MNGVQHLLICNLINCLCVQLLLCWMTFTGQSMPTINDSLRERSAKVRGTSSPVRSQTSPQEIVCNIQKHHVEEKAKKILKKSSRHPWHKIQKEKLSEYLLFHNIT